MYVDKSKKKLFEEKLREAHIDYHSYEVREHLNLLPQNVIFSNCHDSRPFSSSDEKNRSNICRQLKTFMPMIVKGARYPLLEHYS
mmetsp:Transcript_372/g.529  ORF Transcript_372/g.529 Transcript_372/m.529 type:complete len:85 (+) Transcript_372:224-478(+)